MAIMRMVAIGNNIQQRAVVALLDSRGGSRLENKNSGHYWTVEVSVMNSSHTNDTIAVSVTSSASDGVIAGMDNERFTDDLS